jgi:hypothetical protein
MKRAHRRTGVVPGWALFSTRVLGGLMGYRGELSGFGGQVSGCVHGNSIWIGWRISRGEMDSCIVFLEIGSDWGGGLTRKMPSLQPINLSQSRSVSTAFRDDPKTGCARMTGPNECLKSPCLARVTPHRQPQASANRHEPFDIGSIGGKTEWTTMQDHVTTSPASSLACGCSSSRRSVREGPIVNSEWAPFMKSFVIDAYAF